MFELFLKFEKGKNPLSKKNYPPDEKVKIFNSHSLSRNKIIKI